MPIYDLNSDAFLSLTPDSTTPNNSYFTIAGAAASNSSLAGAGTLGTNLFKIWTPGANGGRLASIYIALIGTEALAVQSQLRYYISNLTGTFKALIGSSTFFANTSAGAVFPIALNWNGVITSTQCILVAFSYVPKILACQNADTVVIP